MEINTIYYVNCDDDEIINMTRGLHNEVSTGIELMSPEHPAGALSTEVRELEERGH